MDFSRFMGPKALQSTNPEQSTIGLGIHYSVLHFNDSFIQSGGDLLDDFIKEHSSVKKWILSSDYAFYDSNKKSDVVTFSLFPHLAHFDVMSECINLMAPSDLKNVSSVSDEFISFLKEGPVFNITLILDRDRRMHSDERIYHLNRIDSMIGLFEHWCVSTPEAKDNYRAIISKLKQVKILVSSPRANLRLFRDIEIVANLAAYLLTEVSIRANVEIISWLSDRDSMLTFKNKIIGDFMLEQVRNAYHVLCTNNGIDPAGKLILVKPNMEGELFYDSFIRVPDYIAGTLADFDFDTQETTHQKF